MDAAEWDARYREHDLVWGIQPNRWVEQELATEPPGTALDLACGEGRNALWLAGLGWDVTAVDFSAVAIEKARRSPARDVGLSYGSSRTRSPTARPSRSTWCCCATCNCRRPSGAPRCVPRGAAARAGRDVAGRRARLGEPDRGHRRPAGPGGALHGRGLRADLAGTDLVVTRAEAVHRPVEGAPRPAIDVLFRATRPNGNLQH